MEARIYDPNWQQMKYHPHAQAAGAEEARPTLGQSDEPRLPRPRLWAAKPAPGTKPGEPVRSGGEGGSMWCPAIQREAERLPGGRHSGQQGGASSKARAAQPTRTWDPGGAAKQEALAHLGREGRREQCSTSRRLPGGRLLSTWPAAGWCTGWG